MAQKEKYAFARPIGEYKTVGDGKWSDSQAGLTKREYFAAKAMQGLLANSEMADLKIENIALSSVIAADWLIKTLENVDPNK